jgi:hypothetical protein
MLKCWIVVFLNPVSLFELVLFFVTTNLYNNWAWTWIYDDTYVCIRKHQIRNFLASLLTAVIRDDNKLNQLKNSSRLNSVINSLNLVRESNQSNLSWKLSSLNKWVELELYIVRLVWFASKLIEKNQLKVYELLLTRFNKLGRFIWF